MPPMAGHDKFAERLTCSGSQLGLPQFLREGLWVAGIPDGYGGNGLPALRNSEDFAGFGPIKARHLMDEEAA